MTNLTSADTGPSTRWPATEETPTSVAARALGVPEARLGVIGQDLTVPDAEGVDHALAAAVVDEPDRALASGSGVGAPVWGVIEATAGDQLAFTCALVHVPESVFGVEVVARLHENEWGQRLELLAAVESVTSLPARLRRWLAHVTGSGSPYRFGQFQVTSRQGELVLRRWESGSPTRDELQVSADVWRAVDRHAHGSLRLVDLLAGQGLASSSGLLFVGPPGTGKSQLARIVAHELRGRATVLVPGGSTAYRGFRRVFELAARLAPSLVIIDDLDLVVGSRHGGDAEQLHDFLNTMDRAVLHDKGVIVLASTNDPKSIDPAAVRASRFDVMVEMTAPEHEGRVRVLRRYLALFPDVDLGRVAAATDGATGADLRDLARRAVITSEGKVTTQVLLTAAAEGAWQSTLVDGAYL